MALLGMDLGGTKLATALFTGEGKLLHKEITALNGRKGKEAGALITARLSDFLSLASLHGDTVHAIGISVPGISHTQTGTVWVPNIPGWDDYPLLEEVKAVSGAIPVIIDNDRACYILGESWQGKAAGCTDAIFLAVGTGIGAGIFVNGAVLRGAHDIAGAIGWMALSRPFHEDYISCGCFEHYASGEGIARIARQFLKAEPASAGRLHSKDPEEITARDVFKAYEHNDPLAVKVIALCIECWGMAVANLVSLFNPEKIIFGGGVFGPAIPLLPAIKKEAARWAQPLSMRRVSLEASALGGDAGIYGAAFAALKNYISPAHIM